MSKKISEEHQSIEEHAHQADEASGKETRFDKYFRAMSKADASDLHLKAGASPHIRINSLLSPTRAEPLTSEEVSEMAFGMMTAKQRDFFLEHGSLDLAREITGSDRFRVNVYRQRGHISIAIRRVTWEIPDFATLHLPETLSQIASATQGLVLLSGPTGCGKSTTIAAMLEHINKTRACHIVTIEDPIEYLYTDKKALINQREIGIDVDDFESALKYLMRADPDVVLIGEMRDRETFQAALHASETGHIVFGTIHASGAGQTIGRILDLFPQEDRSLVRQTLAFNLQAIVCQKLLPSIAKGIERIPAVEILLTNPSVRQLIEESRENELIEVILSHEQEGMMSFTRSLLTLIEKDYIDPRTAYEVAPNVDELKMVMKGISASRSGLLG